MKKNKKIAAAILCLFVAAVIVLILYQQRPIGTVVDAEWDKVIIDGVEYIRQGNVPSESPHYSAADKGRKLGIIQSGDHTLHVYSIKGDKERNFLYVRWEWEGEIYIRRGYILKVT